MSDKKLDMILKKLDVVIHEQQEMKQEQQEMKQEQQEMKQDQQEMKQDQQNMRAEMNSHFDTLETRFSQEQVVKNTENIAVMQADIKELKDGQEKLLTIQQRQEKTIDLLARRSIDQEAELRYIK